MQDPKIKRAIISLTDKTGIEEFARTLVDEFGVEIDEDLYESGLLEE